MTGLRSYGRILFVLPLLLLFACVLSTVAYGQGLQQVPAPSNPSNDCGFFRGDDAIPVSSGMLAPFLPKIPNLELGYQYYFGNNVRTGRFSADYVLPFRLRTDSVLFGEAHAEGWDFWKRPTVSVAAPPDFTVTTSATSNRVDLSFGGGYRTMLGANTLLGVNGFYDTSRLFNSWYSSGGVGLELAANIAGDDAIDLNFNWYGNLFNRDVLVNAFRNKGNSFDVEVGYSHALFNQALDFRLKVIGYQFDIGTPVRGWRGGADLTTRDGMFTLRYEHGSDRLNGDYNTIGGFVTLGLNLENVLRGENPLTLPEPVFKSPRDLRRLLGLKVKRNWHQPESVVLSRSFAPTPAPTPGPTPGSPPLFQTTVVLPAGTWPAGGAGAIVGLAPPVPQSVLGSATSMTITISGFSNDTGTAAFVLYNLTIPAPTDQFLITPVPISNGSGSVTFTDSRYWTHNALGPATSIANHPSSMVLHTPAGATMTIRWD
jgi:hypothetical protein